jgi:adenosylhomocysteine nucleosidase
VSDADPKSFVIAATGLKAEARIAARVPRVRAIAGGTKTGRLQRLIDEAVAQGGCALISFGIAAGLAHEQQAGTCLIGSEVVHEGIRYAADEDWANRLRATLGESELAAIAGVDHPLQTLAEKRALHAVSGAEAADMESHIVARLATGHGLPFAVVRVVADTAEGEVPHAAVAGFAEDGGLNVLAVIASLARAPGQLPAMMRLGADTRRAFAALFRCHRRLGPGFGFFDLV